MRDVEGSDAYEKLKAAAIAEIRKNLGMLSEIQQRYAKLILFDIENEILVVEEGRKFMDYIQEYMARIERENIESFSAILGIDAEELYILYKEYSSGEVDPLKLEKLKKTADFERVKAYYGCTALKARARLHADLKKFIEERKAEYEEEG